jgi:hypothetical protein
MSLKYGRGRMARKNIDVAFVRMRIGPSLTRPAPRKQPSFFLRKIEIPYPYFDSDLARFGKKLDGTGVEVRVLEGYSQ